MHQQQRQPLPGLSQHQQTYRPAPAASTAQAMLAAAVTLASFAMIGALLALGI